MSRIFDAGRTGTPPPRWGRTGASPQKSWYDEWQSRRTALNAAHAVSSALATGTRDVDRRLRELGSITGARSARTQLEGGVNAFRQIVQVLCSDLPALPATGDDHIVRLLWWWWSCLGFARRELWAAAAMPELVQRDGERISLSQIDRMMWRSGGSPPVRGAAPSGLLRLTTALSEAADDATEADPLLQVWSPCAVARLRVLRPDALALVAMLAHLAKEPIDLSGLGDHALHLTPIALSDAFATSAGVRRTIQAAVTVGLVVHGRDGVSLTVEPSVVVPALTDAERRFGATAAVAAMHWLFPERTQRATTWARANALRGHAYVAADASESVDVGESWRASLLERVSILDLEHGRVREAVDAGRRALAAAERARSDTEQLAGILVNYARALAADGNAALADACFARALDLESDAFDRAATLNLYANFLSDQGQHEKAVSYQRRALGLVGDSGEQVQAEVGHDLSLTLSRAGEHASALRELRAAAQLRGVDDETRLLIQVRTAAALNAVGEHDEARAVIERSLPSIEAVFGRSSWTYVNALHARGVALDVLAERSGRKADAQYAAREYRAYRALRQELEAAPEGAAGLAVEV